MYNGIIFLSVLFAPVECAPSDSIGTHNNNNKYTCHFNFSYIRAYAQSLCFCSLLAIYNSFLNSMNAKKDVESQQQQQRSEPTGAYALNNIKSMLAYDCNWEFVHACGYTMHVCKWINYGFGVNQTVVIPRKANHLFRRGFDLFRLADLRTTFKYMSIFILFEV